LLLASKKGILILTQMYPKWTSLALLCNCPVFQYTLFSQFGSR